METTPAVLVLWSIGLLVAYLSVPLLLKRLTRILVAARRIEAYAQETRTATQGIATNLEGIPALDTTAELLAAAKGVGASIAEETEGITAVLARRGAS